MDGLTHIDGPFPINPSGGLKSRGHPVGASGLAQIVETIRQMRGEVDSKCQVGKTDIALTHSIGGIGNNNFVVILERVRERIKPTRKTAGYNLPIHITRIKGPHDQEIKVNETEGFIETFTTLHVTPEGFPSP